MLKINKEWSHKNLWLLRATMRRWLAQKEMYNVKLL